jgi:hypothetical protein
LIAAEIKAFKRFKLLHWFQRGNLIVV